MHIFLIGRKHKLGSDNICYSFLNVGTFQSPETQQVSEKHMHVACVVVSRLDEGFHLPGAQQPHLDQKSTGGIEKFTVRK